MAGNYSDQTTGFTNVAVGALNSNATTAGKLDLRTNMAVLSMQTRANASGMTTGELRIVFAASGCSIIYSSGKTQYTLGESATSLAQS